jgi:hypothetical protein
VSPTWVAAGLVWLIELAVPGEPVLENADACPTTTGAAQVRGTFGPAVSVAAVDPAVRVRAFGPRSVSVGPLKNV